MENSHFQSAVTTKYFQQFSRGMAFLRAYRRALFQKWNIGMRMEWLFSNNAEYVLIPEYGQSNVPERYTVMDSHARKYQLPFDNKTFVRHYGFDRE